MRIQKILKQILYKYSRFQLNTSNQKSGTFFATPGIIRTSQYKNSGNFEAHLVLRPGVFQIQQHRIFNNLFLTTDKMDSYVICTGVCGTGLENWPICRLKLAQK